MFRTLMVSLLLLVQRMCRELSTTIWISGSGGAERECKERNKGEEELVCKCYEVYLNSSTVVSSQKYTVNLRSILRQYVGIYRASI